MRRSPASRAGRRRFIGGDAIGISRDSKVADAAWNFLAWVESDEAQINVVAKGGNVLSRPDLANNKYSAMDPRLVLFNSVAKNGQTPFAKNFGATFNDPQGPWLVLLRDAVFGDASKIDADNKAINAFAEIRRKLRTLGVVGQCAPATPRLSRHSRG